MWTYARFAADVHHLVGVLHRLGVRAGDRVATVTQNRPEVYMTYFACWLMGAAACPVNVEERSERKRFILDNADCRVALVEEAYFDEIETLQDELPSLRAVLPIETILQEPADEVSLSAQPLASPAFLVYTSGTTGDPKGVLLRHSNLLVNAQATVDWHSLRPGDGMMTVLPIHHVNGAIVTGLTSFLAGGRNVLNRRFSSSAFWERLARERVAIASMVPTLLEFLLSADEDITRYDLSALRYLICGAGPLLSETVIGFENRFDVPICHGFGMSETTAYNTQMPMQLSRQERQNWYKAYGYPSIGRSISCNEVTILRPDGSHADPLERGEIAIRGPTVMSGYLNNPEANAKAFRNGWFLSGDQGFYQVDAGGERFFFISGRIKELIIRGGVNISPLDIDDVLNRLDGVAFALAVPFENTFYGEEIGAYVVLRPGSTLTAADVLAHARQHLPYARCPKVVVFGDDVPFTATGKPKRIQLAQMLAETFRPYRTRQFREST